ncbi:MAG: hypothetical protein GY866_24115 [Proteobacteria bacterium]|nr:hypothetical protein [Pseudomonadota bacterium]
MPGFRKGVPTDDVSIRLGTMPTDFDAVEEGVRCAVAPGRMGLTVDNVAMYLVRDGREIVVESADGADGDSIRLFLLGAPLGALLQQRIVLSLHAGAVVIEDGVVVVAGISGIVKSTILATLFGTVKKEQGQIQERDLVQTCDS